MLYTLLWVCPFVLLPETGSVFDRNLHVFGTDFLTPPKRLTDRSPADPEDLHPLLKPDKTWVVCGPRENHLRPAIDPLFRSAAVTDILIAAVLTGLLADEAARGTRRLVGSTSWHWCSESTLSGTSAFKRCSECRMVCHYGYFTLTSRRLRTGLPASVSSARKV